MTRFAEISGPDLRALRKSARVTAQQIADHSGLSYHTVKNTERVNRISVGRDTLIRYFGAIAAVAAERRQPNRRFDAAAHAAAMAELREQGKDRARRSLIRDPALRAELDAQKARRDQLQTDDGLLDLFLAERCRVADPNSLLVIPLEAFVTALDSFLDDEQLRRDRPKMHRLLAQHLRQRYHVGPNGVSGLLVDWKPGHTQRYESVTRERSPHADLWDEVVADSIESERERVKPGLRHRWGERPKPPVSELDYLAAGLPIPPIATRRR
jgi:transcriptional regulator with XRE-family HTH domain